MTDTLSPDRDAKIEEDNVRDEAIEWALRPAASVVRYGPTRKFSTDPVAFEALLQEIGRRGLGERYMRLLVEIVAGWHVQLAKTTMSISHAWACASATTDRKAAAALAALKEATT